MNPNTENPASRLSLVSEAFFSKYWRWELRDGDASASSVKEELIRRLPHIDRESWEARFHLGGVYVMGRAANADEPLTLPCRLEYYEPKLPLEELSHFFPTVSERSILYCDDDVAVVIKPAGLPTTAARDQRLYNLERALKELFGGPLHLPSRLDTAVSGVLLVSRSSRMNRALQRAYDKRQVAKYYLAEVEGSPQWDARTCLAPIVRDEQHPVLRRCAQGAEDGEIAHTRFTVLDRRAVTNSERTLLLAEPITGRTHQIRLHCQHEGYPIIGDPFYGSGGDGELRLISHAIRFFHPYRQEMMEFSYRPDGAVWCNAALPMAEIRAGFTPSLRA